MPAIQANGIMIEYEDHGDKAAPPILLIMGLGAQLTLWPIELVDALVAHGFRVIRYDNRDIGLSTKFDGAGVPNIRTLALKSLFGIKPRVPYTLDDMADDAAQLLDGLGIDKAHIVGASMGGMIAQLFAVNHAERTLSLTSIMSTTGNRRLPAASREAMAVLTKRPQTADAETMIEFGMNAARTIGSPAYPADPTLLRERVTSNFERSYSPAGVARQMAAIIANGDRRARLSSITAPTLVIHGDGDPLVPLPGGKDTAANIKGAELLVVPGMGHDLPQQLVKTIADAIAGVTARTAVVA